MSRIGRMPITVPAGVTVTVAENNVVTVKGPKGELTETMHPDMIIKLEENVINVQRPTEEKMHKALHGLTRQLIQNMVTGVTQGFEKKLEIVGVGYKAQKSGKTLTLNLGHSHPIYFEEANGITFDVPTEREIFIRGINRQVVGQVAADIRSKRPPEPYKGKGVKYAGEKIRRKTGKTGK